MLTPLFLQLLMPQIPQGGTPVVGERLAIQGDARYGTVETVPVRDQPFTTAVHVTTAKVPPNEWEFEVGTDVTVAVKKGDVMLATVYVRAIKGQPETGEGRTVLDFQTKGGEWSKSVSHPISITKIWRRIDVPFVVGYDTPAGGANVAFRLGGLVQTVEIGGLSILDYGPSFDIGKLPRTAIHYRGEEPNAPWRKAALARIEKIRKGDFTLRVMDAKGRPVSGAKVTAEMTRHAFPFGTAVAADELFVKGADADRYRAELLKDFNRATVENNLKWPFWETWGKSDGMKAVDWLDEHGLSVRAHNVVWPSWRNSPPDLQTLSGDALRARIDRHIDDVVGAMKGKVDVWDVVNEPFDNHDVFDRLQTDPVAMMAGWFRRVKAIDPKPVLMLNDYPPLDGGATGNPHLESFYKNLAGLKASGAPLEGIGFQAHIGGEPIPPVRVLAGLDRFAKFGLPIEISEFDINSQDRDYQARYMRDFLTAVFSHPSVGGFTQWGFWANRHWLPDAALFDADWKLRPHGKVYLDLIDRQWHTKAMGKTGPDGTYRFRGFYGDYRVSAQKDGRAGESKPRLLQAHRTAVLTLP
ncbi:hypothetical protein BH11ARM2_BH11ARM2_10390 [soil metagenome]